MDEFCLGVVAQIVVTEEIVGCKEVRQVEPLLLKRLLVHVVPDADLSLSDEVHLENLFFFVVDHVFVVFLAEVSWFESESDIVQELALFVLLWVEEETEVVEYVIKEVVHDNASLDRAWKRVDEVIVLLDLRESVVRPIVLEVLVDLAVE